MSKTYDIEPLDEAIARGVHDDDLFAILMAAWERMPEVERYEVRRVLSERP